MISDFVRSYIETALWSSININSEEEENCSRTFEEDNYDITDLSPECLEKMTKDCAAFREYAAEELSSIGSTTEQDGGDFWLTRNRYGAGFLDRDYGRIGDTLSDKARSFGEVYLYLNKQGQVCQS